MKIRFYFKTHKSADDAVWLANSVAELCCVKNHRFVKRTAIVNGEFVYTENFALAVKEGVYDCGKKERSLFVKAPVRLVHEMVGDDRDKTPPGILPSIPRAWIETVYEKTDRTIVEGLHSWLNQTLNELQANHELVDSEETFSPELKSSYYERNLVFAKKKQKWTYAKTFKKPKKTE